MNNLSTILKYSTTLLVFSLIGSPVSAAEITCTQNKDCATLGYDKPISECVGDILKCPFDTNLANCKILEITPEQICKQKIIDLGYSSDIDATKGTVVLYKSLTAETVQPKVKYISAAKLGIAECSSFASKPILTLTGKTINLIENKFNSIDIKLTYSGSGAEVNSLDGTNYFAHSIITDNTGGSGAILNIGTSSIRGYIFSGQYDYDYKYDDPIEKKSGGNITYGFKRGINVVYGIIVSNGYNENVNITGDLKIGKEGSSNFTLPYKLNIGGTLTVDTYTPFQGGSSRSGGSFGTSTNGTQTTNSTLKIGSLVLNGGNFGVYNADVTISKTSYAYPNSSLNFQLGKGTFTDLRVSNTMRKYNIENFTVSGKITRF